jgi:hypothetical protein
MEYILAFILSYSFIYCFSRVMGDENSSFALFKLCSDSDLSSLFVLPVEYYCQVNLKQNRHVKRDCSMAEDDRDVGIMKYVRYCFCHIG